jgi:hypothetical protein
MILLAAALTAFGASLTTVSPAPPTDNVAVSASSTGEVRDTVPARLDSALVVAFDDSLRVLLLRVPSDTGRPRPKAIELSDWYERRLRIHRYLSYAVIPLFAVQYAAGEQLFDKGSTAPDWAKTTHRFGATALAGVFGVNTVTGLWNLWDSRHVPDHRALRVAHSVLMLAADAGFTYAGVKLSEDAERSVAKRREHRTIALASIGVSTVSGLVMYFGNR